MTVPTQTRPLIFGEVLFDRFPDKARLGGAPFNVAWHLTGFGLMPHFISRIGTDQPGDEILTRMKAWGMDISGVQRDNIHPTGSVDIAMEGTHHTFTITPDQAYDYIDYAASKASLPTQSLLLYHGSLALRSTVSRSTLTTLRQETGLPAFVDINVRHPWWSEAIATIALHNATWTKLSEEELNLLVPGPHSRLERTKQLQQQIHCDTIYLTKGSGGAALVSPEDTTEYKPTSPVVVADTVGAGDAFTAVAILGIARGWSHNISLLRAMQFAEKICGIKGALFHNKTVYEDFLQECEQ